jgi:hypothetical protein
MYRVLTFVGETSKWAAMQLPPTFPGFKEKLVKRSDRMELWNMGEAGFECRLFQGQYIIGVKPIGVRP